MATITREAAASRGAAAMICERPLPVFNVPQCVVADSRIAYGRLCQALVGNPSRQMKVIGVTGTHGKTTVARLLSAILREAGLTVGTLDSFGYWDGVEDRPPIRWALTPPVLARSLAEMAAIGATHAVVEISSRDLARQTFARRDARRGLHHAHRQATISIGTARCENYRKPSGGLSNTWMQTRVAILNADDPVLGRDSERT